MKKMTGFLSYALVCISVYFAVTKLTTNPELFVSSHGLVIVVGGLFVAAFASFPSSLLADSFVSVYRAMAPKGRVSVDLVEEIVAATKNYHRGVAELERSIEGINHSFLKQSLNLVLEGIPAGMIGEILNKRIDEKVSAGHSQSNVMLTLSKYSPALGLAATVLGLVDLLGQLASADMGRLGTGMAIALSSTFFGVVISNLLFAPMAELISSSGETEVREMELVKDGIESMLSKHNYLVVGELANSYLDENRRVDFVNESRESKAA